MFPNFATLNSMVNTEENRLMLLSEIFKALANPGRLALLEKLQGGPRCVCELAAELDMNKSIASKHLSQLQDVGLVRSSKKGVTVNYELAAPCVLEMTACTLGAVKKEMSARFS